MRAHPSDLAASGTNELDGTVVQAHDVTRRYGQGATAVDMETSSIGAVWERQGLPWTVFRAISDRVQDELVDDVIAGLARPDGSPNFPAVARLLLRRPQEVRRLVRIARDAKRATTAAAEAAVGVCLSP